MESKILFTSIVQHEVLMAVELEKEVKGVILSNKIRELFKIE